MTPFPKWFLLPAVLVLAACAATPARENASQSAAGDAEAATLYTRLEADSRRYAAGLELLRAGDTAKAQADIKTATNYVKQAVGESVSGKPVSTPITQAYGCSIKYAV